MGRKVVSSVCMWCHSHCKVKCHVEDGTLLKLEGDVNAPRGKLFVKTVAACPRAAAAGEWAHHPERTKFPLKRVGERGGNRWQRLSWDDALDEIAQRLGRLRDSYGAETIATTSGTYRSPDEYRRRFFNLFGSPNCFTQGHICWAVSNVVSAAMSGLSCNAFTPFPGKTKSILLIGTNPARSERTSWQQILDTVDAGARLIVVDPRRTATARKAHLFLPVRPGTDLALLLAMLHVIVGEELYDREFVSRHCHGFDQLAAHVGQYTPAWAAEVCGVPATDIARAARIYATDRPSASCSYLGLDQVSNSVQALHARYALTALTGNLDVRGGDMGRPPTQGYNTEYSVELCERLPAAQKAKQLGAARFKLLGYPGYDLIQRQVEKLWGRKMTSSHHLFAHAPTVFRAAVSGEPYPVRGMITMGSNPLVTYANARLIHQALNSLDLYVVADPFMTPSAQLADYVLPTGNWLERPLLFTGSDTAGFIVGGKAVLPLLSGEQFHRRTDFDVWRGLGVRLGQADDWPWEDLEQAYDDRQEPIGHTLESFAAAGGHVSLRGYYKKWGEVGFATKTGKFELYSTVFEELGYDPLPNYVEPAESPVSTPDIAEQFPLVLITGGRFVQAYHSEHRQVASLRKRHPDPLVQLHPDVAKELRIDDGDWVWIETLRGRVRQRCRLDEGIRRDVVHAEHGWWFPEQPGSEPSLHGVWESNVNVLTDDDPEICNELSGGWPLRALLCKVYRA